MSFWIAKGHESNAPSSPPLKVRGGEEGALLSANEDV